MNKRRQIVIAWALGMIAGSVLAQIFTSSLGGGMGL